jgi:pimeloyl-ACP methyl ester carboxylesterase
VLAFDSSGEGPTVLLLHGTSSSRRIWDGLREQLDSEAHTIALDLPGHGESPRSSFTPPEWAAEVAAWLKERAHDRVLVIGHSSGGWTALELAKLGCASGVLALAPAGLWRKRSPLVTNVLLQANWGLGRISGPLAPVLLRSRGVRALSLKAISHRPGEVPAELAIQSARVASANTSFPRHFSETKRLRFRGGRAIDVPVTVVWGERDRIALASRSRNLDELPAQTAVETWSGCGHMLTWDAPERVLQAARALLYEARDGA